MGFSFPHVVVVTSTFVRACLFAAGLFSAQAAAPRLDPPIVSADRNVQLTVQGDVGAEYSIEWSVNLSQWNLVTTGTAVNGSLTVHHDASAYSIIFYRAKTTSPAQGLRVYPEYLALNVGDESGLIALQSAEARQWSSSDPSIATVDTNGVVRAIAKGSATITVSSAGQTSSANITVFTSGGANPDAGSDTLIAQALARNEITAEQELIYRTYATFGDSRLPAQFRGAPSPTENDLLLSEIRNRLNTLSPAAQQILSPFLRPPIYADSWYAQQLGLPAATPQNIDAGGTGGNINCSATIAPQLYTRRSTAHFNVINLTLGDPLYDRLSIRLAELAVAIAEQVYAAETALLGRFPLADTGEGCNGGDGAVDIYITSTAAPNLIAQTVPYRETCANVPSYIFLYHSSDILLRAGLISPADGAPTVRAVLAHEFMHVLQFAMNRPNDCADSKWFDEATAQWAIDYVDSSFNHEDGFEKQSRTLKRSGTFYSEYLVTDHTASIENTGPGGDPDANGYCDYIFFQFLARKYSPSVMKNIFDANAAGNRSVEAIAAGLSSRGGMKNVWPEFAATLWNDYNADVLDFWNTQDQYDLGLQYIYSPQGSEFRVRSGPDLKTIEVNQQGESRARFILLKNAARFPSGYEIEPRSFYYEHLKFTDPTVHSALFFNPIAALPATHREFIKVQALTKIGGQWNGPLDWTEEVHKQFCLDKKDERLEELIIIVSNSEANRGSEKPFELSDEFPMQVSTSNVGCWKWEGSSSTETLGTDGTAHKATATDVVWEVLTVIPGIIYFETTGGNATGSQTTPLGECSITSGGALRPITKHAIPDGRLDYSLDLHLGLGENPDRDVLTASGSTELFTTTIFRCPDFTQTTSGNQSWGWLDHSSTNLTVSADGQTIEGNISETSPIGVRKTIFKFTAKREE